MVKLFIEEVESTNHTLRELMDQNKVEAPMALCSDFQSAGRGLQQNKWFSEKGKNLLFSILLSPQNIYTDHVFLLSQIVSIAIIKTLNKYSKHFSIKWPNDIYWKEKKITGILIENDIAGDQIINSIIGIGININQEIFPDHLPNPISLFQITQTEHDRQEILDQILLNIEKLLHAFETKKISVNNINKRYHSLLYHRDGSYPYSTPSGEHFIANIHSVANNGILCLQLSNGDLRNFEFKQIIFD